ncbi:hypothetical protein BDM02DRAFT_3259188 [Thelephora ganbajun]|uniref:Uncharacterized protein n=1 Tax=Thelephora ganbajun TaxID=370292 RepID=A0ACB6ZMZ3_THEGA|nr:hypothetical protein BDM02DRAFT_3259188 [Thelephora ganbajun]
MVVIQATTNWSFKGADLPIDTVTVYRPSGAQVIRKLDLDLKAGNNVIEVTGLSSVTDTESFRVSGLGNARLLVVNCIREQFTEISESDPIRALEFLEDKLQAEEDAKEAEIGMLKAFGSKMGDKPDLTPDQASSFADALYEKTLACAEIVKALDDKIAEIRRRIDKAESERAGSAFVKAVITIVANDDGPVQLKLTYRVGDAHWSPLYDLYATSEDGKPSGSVSLHYRVNLQQTTGEDWKDAKLVLSTSATDMLDAGVPASDSLTIQPRGKTPPPPPPPLRTRQTARKTTSQLDSIPTQPTALGSLATFMMPLVPLIEGSAIVSKSQMAVSYTVNEPTTISSVRLWHKVLVAIIPFEATISHITSPRKSPIAYLQCAVKNTSDYYLLPGTMSIFLNNSYVSQTNIPDIATGDTFNCTLGMDTSIRVSYEITESSVTSTPSSFVEQYRTTTYVSTTKLQNRHTGDYPVNIVERSSIPIASENDPRIKVFLKGPAGLAESEEGDSVDVGRGDGFQVKWGRDVEDTKNGQKEGKFVWYGTIPPGKEVVLVSEWDVRAPVDAEWRVKSE